MSATRSRTGIRAFLAPQPGLGYVVLSRLGMAVEIDV
jgi:hypothetical protein